MNEPHCQQPCPVWYHVPGFFHNHNRKEDSPMVYSRRWGPAGMRVPHSRAWGCDSASVTPGRWDNTFAPLKRCGSGGDSFSLSPVLSWTVAQFFRQSNRNFCLSRSAATGIGAYGVCRYLFVAWMPKNCSTEDSGPSF